MKIVDHACGHRWPTGDAQDAQPTWSPEWRVRPPPPSVDSKRPCPMCIEKAKVRWSIRAESPILCEVLVGITAGQVVVGVRTVEEWPAYVGDNPVDLVHGWFSKVLYRMTTDFPWIAESQIRPPIITSEFLPRKGDEVEPDWRTSFTVPEDAYAA